MPASRLLLLSLSLLLAACAQVPTEDAPAPVPEPAVQAPPAPPPAAPPAPRVHMPVAPSPAEAAQFRQCIAGLRAPALAAGVSAATFDRHAAGIAPDMGVLPLLDRQPEFTLPLWDYLAALVDEERVADGRRLLAEHADILRTVEQRHGVDPATVVAVWGVESDFGRIPGTRPLLQSLGTLSCFGRRQPFFRSELYEALKILQRGDVAEADLVGSWAGAFGQTQFMPSTYNRIAVDTDGDGRRDLVRSVPDALGSTANYLARSGWRSGQPWGHEVVLPANFNAALAGRTNRRPLSQSLALGVRRADGGGIDLPADTRSAILLPAGKAGPAFLVFRNYDAIYSYNAAESYALAIALLADRLRGGSGLRTPWPTDDPGLSRAQRRELQALLAARGHDIGAIDGAIGGRTRAAVLAEQQRLGMAADGRPGQKLLQALRAAR